VDFDDADFGFKEEGKSLIKGQNEEILRDLVEKCDGLYGTMAEAISELETPRIKSVKPYKTYEGLLTLGDPTMHEDAMSINVERYFKTHKATVPPASRVVIKTGSDGGPANSDEMQGVEPTPSFSAVKDARTYRVNDPAVPGGKLDVDRDELAKGYEYGRTAVHISESDYNITKIETRKGFSIVGFIYQEKVRSQPQAQNHILTTIVRALPEYGRDMHDDSPKVQRCSSLETIIAHSFAP
jgi:ATP-dependent DNA helicase 2 subunit 2